MNSSRMVRNAYRRTESLGNVHPVKLIHMMYDRVLTHLRLVEEGIRENDVKKRGENLSKAIAIVTELNASIKEDDNGDAASFLRGLYTSILVELTKVPISLDIGVVTQASRYLEGLKEIWEKTAMVEAGLQKSGPEEGLESGEEAAPVDGAPSSGRNYKAADGSLAQGVSVAI